MGRPRKQPTPPLVLPDDGVERPEPLDLRARRLDPEGGVSPEMVKEKKKQFILDVMFRGKKLAEACQEACISSRTVADWQRSDPIFADAVQEALCLQIDAIEARVFANCVDPNPSHNVLRMFTLKCLRPDKWRDRPELEARDIKDITPEVAAAGIAAMLKAAQDPPASLPEPEVV